MASPILDNATIPTLTKSITEESILQFESCGFLERENIHNNYELAAPAPGHYLHAGFRQDVRYLCFRSSAPLLRSGAFNTRAALT